MPLLLMGVIAATFSTGRLQDLPVAVIDDAASSLSREIMRAIDALPSVKLVAFQNRSEASAALRRMEVYGVVHLPLDLDRALLRREPAVVSVWLNGQLLLVANALETDLTVTMQSLSQHYAALPPPLSVQRTTLGNPGLDFFPFLAGTAVPCMLQIVLLLSSIWVVGIELRDGSALRWWKLGGRSGLVALSAKLAPILLWGVVWGWLWLTWMHAPWLPQGWGLHWTAALNPLWLLMGWGVFVVAILGLGAAVVLLTANLRFALSAGAFFSAPAMAFVGVTFPHESMPPVALFWAHLIPVTHYLQWLEGVTYKGALNGFALLSLGGTALLCWGISLLCLRSRCTGKRYWRRR